MELVFLDLNQKMIGTDQPVQNQRKTSFRDHHPEYPTGNPADTVNFKYTSSETFIFNLPQYVDFYEDLII